MPPEIPHYNFRQRQPINYRHQAVQYLVAPQINHIYDDSGKKLKLDDLLKKNKRIIQYGTKASAMNMED